MFDITILVAIYNADINKLIHTLYSIIIQKEVGFEIIVCDDGSRIDLTDQIEEFFLKQKFDKYKVVRSEKNVGTVRNLLNGSQYCNSEIVKCISPGDWFSNEFALKKYLDAFKVQNADVVFSDSQYYSHNNNLTLFNLHAPKLISPYGKKYSQKKIIKNLVLCNDFISGAATAYKLNVFTKYLNELTLNNIVYAEDLSTLLLAVDGFKFAYIDEDLIWYEYGTGISFKKSTSVSGLVFKDQQILYSNCLAKRTSNSLVRRCVRGYRYLGKTKSILVKKLVRNILFPEKIIFRIKVLLTKRKNKLSKEDFYKYKESLI